MRLGIQQKIGAVLALLVAISLSIISLAYISLENLNAVAEKSVNLFIEFRTVNRLQMTLERRISPSALAAASGTPREHGAFKDAMAEIDDLMRQLADTPTLFEPEERILDTIREHKDEIDDLADRAFFSGKPAGARAKAAAAKAIEGRLLQIDRLLDRWRALDQKEIEAEALQSNSVHQIQRELLMGSLAVLLIGGMISFSVARFISKPLVELHQGVEKIGRGDLFYTAKIRTGDEIQGLAEAFNQLVYNLRQEEETASEIQRRLLPQEELRAPGVRVHARQIHAKLVGGDWFDYYKYGDEVRLLVADASGKGMPGALLATVGMSAIRSEPKFSGTIENILRKTNKTVTNRFGSTDFITLQSAQLSPATRQFVYLNCGHEPPLHYSAAKDVWSLLSCPSGLPLGISVEMFDPEPVMMTLGPGDQLIMYTDGLHDVRDKQGRFLSMEAIVDWLNERRGKDIGAITDDLINKAIGFSSGPLTDDITLLGIALTEKTAT